MIEFHDISLRFGRKTVLSGVSFAMPERGITVLAGPNGSGKTTLLSCVNGQQRYSGKILFRGEDLNTVPPQQRAKRIALLPQAMPAPHVTAFELAAFGRSPHLGISGKLTENDKEKVWAALKKVRADDLADRYVDTLSGGERQRVNLAMILAQDTPCILLDEPTAHLDPACTAEFVERLLPLKKEKSILLVLHDLSLAVTVADYVAVLEAGRLRFFGAKDACLQENVFEKVFRVRRFTDGDRIFFGT